MRKILPLVNGLRSGSTTVEHPVCSLGFLCLPFLLQLEDAAVNRLAKSITQLTLCQVTTDEVDTATKLLDKACQKLRGIQDVPSQRITDLAAAIRQMRQLSCILDSCTISASYEVSQAQKAILLMPRTAKGASTSSEELVRTPPERRIQTLFKKGRILAWPKLAALCFAMIVADLSLAHFSGGGQIQTFLFSIFKLLARPFNLVCERVTVMLVLARDTS